jgi:ParB family chromosome partitioning protein
MTKADQLGDSDSFAAVTTTRSARRRLIDEATGDAPPAAAHTARLGDLAHNPFNPRQTLGDLQETADSLLERGQVQPVTVVTRQAFLVAHPGTDDDIGAARYVVIDGNRRLGAARLAGLDELRIDVNDTLAASATDLLESALVANIQREDLSPLEEAEALAALVKVHGSQRQVARRVGKSHVWVSQRLALLDLTPGLQESLRDGDITVEAARQVARLPQDQQADAARDAAETRTENRQARKERTPTPPPPPPAPAIGARGNGVSTPSPGHALGNTTTGAASPQEPKPSATGGNGVSTPPAAGLEDGRTATLDWGNLPVLASLLREHLDQPQRRELATLITTEG